MHRLAHQQSEWHDNRHQFNVLAMHYLVCVLPHGHEPCAWLEMRLLDACGDVVAGGLGRDIACQIIQADSASEAVFSESLDRAATGIYVAALAHFDLLRPLARHA